MLRQECRDVDSKIEALERQAIKDVVNIEEKVNSDSVRTYREVQQSLEAVTFALETTLKQLCKLASE